MAEVDLMVEINRGAGLSPGLTWSGNLMERTSYIFSTQQISDLTFFDLYNAYYTTFHKKQGIAPYSTSALYLCTAESDLLVLPSLSTDHRLIVHLIEGQLQLS